MPPPDSFLWTVCDQVRGFVDAGLGAAANDIRVTIGTPSLISDDTDSDQINLFFYRFEPSGFEAASDPRDPWQLRISCLITAMGAGSGDEVAGENDLRLLGNVMRIFHQTPILDALDVDGETVRLQAVFMALSEDRINQLWSVQGDSSYRPSVAYELALAPVVPSPRRGQPPLTGAIGSQAHGSLAGRHRAFTGEALGPPVSARNIDLADPEWQPLLCWVIDSDCALSVSHNADGGAFSPVIWVAGDPATGNGIELVWEQWDSASGWSSIGAPVAVTAFSSHIDPDAVPDPVPAEFTRSPPQALTLAADRFSTQYMVYAQRSTASDRSVRSEPLLLTLFRPRP